MEIYLIIVLMALVLIALLTGIILMMRGGEVNRKYGNKLMVARVVLQGLAIGLLGLMFLIK